MKNQYHHSVPVKFAHPRARSAIVAFVTFVLFHSCAFAETVKDDAKKLGHAAGEAVHDVGQGAKKVGKEIGQGAKKAGKAVGEAAKEGGKEFKRAVKGEK